MGDVASGRLGEASDYAEQALTLAVEMVSLDPERDDHVDLVRRSGLDTVRLALDRGDRDQALRGIERMRLAVRLAERANAPPWDLGLLAAGTDLADARVRWGSLENEACMLEERGIAACINVAAHASATQIDLNDLWTMTEEYLFGFEREYRQDLVTRVCRDLGAGGQQERADQFLSRYNLAERKAESAALSKPSSDKPLTSNSLGAKPLPTESQIHSD